MKILLYIVTATVTSGLCTAQLENLRITEVSPSTDQVEVTNTGPAFTTVANRPFCHRFNYASSIPSGTSFGAGEARVFAVSNLNDSDSDLWLYRSGPFGVASNIIDGLKYGPAPNVGRSGLAATIGEWPNAAAFIPAPAAGQTLSFDGFGEAPSDWYVDDTPSLGAVDPITFGTLASGIVVPSGFANFENAELGDTWEAFIDWPFVDGGTVAGDFDVRVIGDVDGSTTNVPVAGSTQWMRVRDQDAVAANRFYTEFLNSGGPQSYELRCFVNPLELPPASAASKPRLTVQHRRTDNSIATMWGVELDATGASLVVLSAGGTPSTTPIGSLPSGVWTEFVLAIDFDDLTATATVGANSVSAPILPEATVDPAQPRFCYRGEGAGNVATLLLDELGFEFEFCQDDLGSQGPGTAVAEFCGTGLGYRQVSTYTVTNAPANAQGLVLVSTFGGTDLPLLGGNLVSISGFQFDAPVQADASGGISIDVTGTSAVGDFVFQTLLVDLSQTDGFTFTNAIRVQTGG